MAKNMKPYKISELKDRKTVLTEVDLAQWRSIIESNINLENEWKGFISATWESEKTPHRGFNGAGAADKAGHLKSMLTFIASYSPKDTFRTIEHRCNSLNDVWDLIRRWANVTESSSKHLSYHRLRRAYDSTSGQTPQEFYFQLRDAMEDTLITVNSKITIGGTALTEDEEPTPALDNIVMLDWLEAVGGTQLIEQVYRFYATNLKKIALVDLQERIATNLPILIIESETASTQASLGRLSFGEAPRTPRAPFQPQYQQRSRGQRPPRRGRSSFRGSQSSRGLPRSATQRTNRFCQLCKANGRPHTSHDITHCFAITPSERRGFSKIGAMYTDEQQEDFDDESATQYEETDGEYDEEEFDEEQEQD